MIFIFYISYFSQWKHFLLVVILDLVNNSNTVLRYIIYTLSVTYISRLLTLCKIKQLLLGYESNLYHIESYESTREYIFSKVL